MYSLKRSQPSVFVQPLLSRHVATQSPLPSPSSSPLPVMSATAADREGNRASSHLLEWISGVALGSGLGVLYWHSSSRSESTTSILSFADWSAAPVSEPTIDDRRPFSVLRKFSLPEISPKFLFGDAFRRKVFFNYEKRIRLRSPPEKDSIAFLVSNINSNRPVKGAYCKVFEYFASDIGSEGEVLMRPADLMRAVVSVFPPSESNLVRDGYLIGERNPGDLRCAPSKFFMLFDVNGDGHISFKEYIFFVTLLSIPESSFSVAFKMFDLDNNGEIDRDEFKKVMALMRAHNRQGSLHRGGIRPGLNVRGSVEDGGLVEYFFGKDGQTRLQHDKFFRFLRDLQDEILNLEFAHYDYKGRGTISAKDFALSMVASAEMGHLDRLLDRVDELDSIPHLRDMRISVDEFKDFGKLRKRLHPFSLALFSYGEVNGLLTREDFQRASSHVCEIPISKNVAEVIFHVFDMNKDGNLSSDEFVRILHKRERDIAQPVGEGLMRFLNCCWNCGNKYSLGQLLSWK